MQQTTALRKIAGSRKKITIVQGGQGASKTFSILMLLINHASSKENREILIIL
jgi:phage terminase large subunit